MTEEDWLKCTDFRAIWFFVHDWLHFLQFPHHCRHDEYPPSGYSASVFSRKYQLAHLAFLRRVWHLLVDESRKLVDLAEADLDNPQSEIEFWSEGRDCWMIQADMAHEANYSTPYFRGLADAGCAVFHAMNGDAQCAGGAVDAAALYAAPEGESEFEQAKKEEQAAQIGLVRDIFGNPFRPVAFNPAWRTSEVVALAQAIYDERDFDRLPTLAGELEKAGCHDADILAHCRGPGPHVRGCWAVDAVLGKE